MDKMYEMIESFYSNYSYNFMRFGSSFGSSCFKTTVIIYTVLLILLFAGMCLAAWKAKKWVRPIGQLAMGIVAFELIEGLRQICNYVQITGGRDLAEMDNELWTNWYLGIGLYPVVNVAIVGILIYLISLFIRIAQKPRI